MTSAEVAADQELTAGLDDVMIEEAGVDDDNELALKGVVLLLNNQWVESREMFEKYKSHSVIIGRTRRYSRCSWRGYGHRLGRDLALLALLPGAARVVNANIRWAGCEEGERTSEPRFLLPQLCSECWHWSTGGGRLGSGA